MVPGNNETDDAVRAACDGWDDATVLHGATAEIHGVTFFGLGGGIPITPWDWSFDLTEEAAARMLESCPEGAVLAVHSPPYGHVDSSRGRSLGSRAVLEAIEAKRPALALCGHIHESWGDEARIGPTRVVNLGPEGRFFEL
jgi:Icc-related predicted phosphoesterase